MGKYIFGDLSGIEEGDIFQDRAALRKAGIHLPLMAGIDGNGLEGACSIVLNGGYVDDFDLDDEILYTGHGGNNLNTKRQIADQSWESSGNKALVISFQKTLPVRVTRGFKHKSNLSPIRGYRYGGLYYVTDHFEEIGKDGFKICRYRLKKFNALIEIPKNNFTVQAPIKPAENSNSDQNETTVMHIIWGNIWKYLREFIKFLSVLVKKNNTRLFSFL